MTQEQLVARPVPGRWSTLEVICHLADFEIIGADRIKRVIAETSRSCSAVMRRYLLLVWPITSGMPKRELLLIALIRQQVARILRTLKPDDFQRRGF